jgi:hypothetical protein
MKKHGHKYILSKYNDPAYNHDIKKPFNEAKEKKDDEE